MRGSWLLGAVFVGALSGCGDDDDDGADSGVHGAGLDGGYDSGANAGIDASGAADAGFESYEAIYATIIQPSCTGSDCHDSSSPAGNLDMSTLNATFDHLLDQKASGPACGNGNVIRVLSKRSDMSLLVQKIEGTQTCGGRMPLNGTPLSAEQIARIRRWVDQGAIFN